MSPPYVNAETRRKVIALKDAIVTDFTVENWLELGILTGCEDLVRGHDRLLRSLRFSDDDYGGAALAVLLSIVGREAANFTFIQDYVDAKYGGAGENISTTLSNNRKIVFAPNVFEVPDGGVDARLVAVMMPFSPEFEAVFAAIQRACARSSMTCLRVKDIWEASSIIQDVFSLIFRSQIVICDYSGRNPNVFYEAGIAHTLGKHVVPLSQSQHDVPFDVAHHRYLPYLNNGEGLVDLEAKLASRLIDLSIPANLRHILG